MRYNKKSNIKIIRKVQNNVFVAWPMLRSNSGIKNHHKMKVPMIEDEIKKLVRKYQKRLEICKNI